MAYFENLFSFSSDKGIVIPDTLEVKAEVERTFKEILGANLDISPSTPAGRMIEALTMLFVNILGVNAQNANSLNPDSAVGNWLDMIGGLFGTIRLDGESDDDYRVRIRNSQSRGMGYVQSIWNAVGQVDGVTSVCVLENGYADPLVTPSGDNGIAIDPHSVFVCVNGGDDEAVARAIYSTKSAGCAYHISDVATPVDVTIADADTGTETPVRFYRPTERFARFTATVRSDAYTGTDIIGDTKSAIVAYMDKHDSNDVVTMGDVITAIGAAGLGIVCTELTIETSEDSETWVEADKIVLRPYQFVSVTNDNITVVV